MMALEPITRAEQIMSGESLTPITREEMFLAKAAGQDVQTPTPITRREMFLSKISANSGGGDTGWVVCEETEPTGSTGISKLQGLRLSLPKATSIGNSVFINCTGLTSVDLPVATSIGSMAFSQCDGLTSIYLPSATIIGDHAFSSCDSLTSVDLPAATSIGEGVFRNCDSLTTVDLPVATSIGSMAFSQCDGLTSIYLPSATIIGDHAFSSCDSLTSVDLPAATSIGNNAFWGCTNLSTLILRNTDSVCQLNVTAVLGTKIVTREGAPTGEGFIYVPSALYEGYVTLVAQQAAMLLMSQGMGEAEAQATADYIARAVLRKIEDYPEICG